jgi:hypothetical protein
LRERRDHHESRNRNQQPDRRCPENRPDQEDRGTRTERRDGEQPAPDHCADHTEKRTRCERARNEEDAALDAAFVLAVDETDVEDFDRCG